MSKRLKAFETMIDAGSDDPFVHYACAMELRSLTRLDEALSAYRAVVKRFPDYVPTYLMSGQLANELGRDEEALALLRLGLEAAKRASDTHAHEELSSLIAEIDVDF